MEQALEGEVQIAVSFFKKIIIPGIILIYGFESFADIRFKSKYPCSNSGKICTKRGKRIIDGFPVTKDCWEWQYSKICKYPSRNDCHQFAHCYFARNQSCLLKDSLGNCVNQVREFSCKSWDPVIIEDKTTRVGLVEKAGKEGIVCRNIPCIDGNCVDKSYWTNGEMMDSISKLYSFSQMNPDKSGGFNLFAGYSDHCSKKATAYSNCCAVNPTGWGRKLGAGCRKNEINLMEKRLKNLCVYVGKESKNKAGIRTLVKHHFCCFGNLLDKVIQVGGRRQLGMNFGYGGRANCRGFTLDEIQRIDWGRVDFTEFIEDFQHRFFAKYKSPRPNDMANRINDQLGSLKDNNQNNNKSGWR